MTSDTTSRKNPRSSKDTPAAVPAEAIGKTTINDIARLAGVSTATASRALSNPDLVAVSTRKAVQAAAENFGYKVNLVARSLRKQCSQAILVLATGPKRIDPPSTS